MMFVSFNSNVKGATSKARAPHPPPRITHVHPWLHTPPDHSRSSLVLIGVRGVLSLVFCVVFCRSLLDRLSLLLDLCTVTVILRFTASDYPFGIYKLFKIKKDCIEYPGDVIGDVHSLHSIRLQLYTITEMTALFQS